MGEGGCSSSHKASEVAGSRRGLSALQVSVDHLQALNSTLVELRKGQQDLEPAVRERRERLLALLQEPGCQGCTEARSRAGALELGADFQKVRAS